jgi:hypothetical protein
LALEKEDIKTVLIVQLLIVSIGFASLLGYILYSYELNENTTNRCELYHTIDKNELAPSSIAGVYHKNSDYYCVWVNERSIDEQKETEMHEHCHYLIDKNYDHFCRDAGAIQYGGQ